MRVAKCWLHGFCVWFAARRMACKRQASPHLVSEKGLIPCAPSLQVSEQLRSARVSVMCWRHVRARPFQAKCGTTSRRGRSIPAVRDVEPVRPRRVSTLVLHAKLFSMIDYMISIIINGVYYCRSSSPVYIRDHADDANRPPIPPYMSGGYGCDMKRTASRRRFARNTQPTDARRRPRKNPWTDTQCVQIETYADQCGLGLPCAQRPSYSHRTAHNAPLALTSITITWSHGHMDTATRSSHDRVFHPRIGLYEPRRTNPERIITCSMQRRTLRTVSGPPGPRNGAMGRCALIHFIRA